MSKMINYDVNKVNRLFLTVIPFVVLFLAYIIASASRLGINPNDKLLPSLSTIGHKIVALVSEPDKRTGSILLINDTLSSLKLLLTGVAVSGIVGLVLGLLNGSIPVFRHLFSPLTTVISLIPPMAILPILFISFGLGDFAKIMLIIIGICPFIIRDIEQATRAIPQEIIVKSLTLGASTGQILTKVLLPQIMPKLFSSLRLTLGSAWLFLISAEAIAANSGLGYRIFLVRRYLDMSVILPYVAWITILAFAMDLILKLISKKLFKWYYL
ncbi:MAG: ABC transporter permease [Succinivibrio sp.]